MLVFDGAGNDAVNLNYTEADDVALIIWVQEHGETEKSFSKAVKQGLCNGRSMIDIRKRFRDHASCNKELKASVMAASCADAAGPAAQAAKGIKAAEPKGPAPGATCSSPDHAIEAILSSVW